MIAPLVVDADAAAAHAAAYFALADFLLLFVLLPEVAAGAAPASVSISIFQKLISLSAFYLCSTSKMD